MDFINSLVTLIGIFLGFAGIALTFVTFFSPEIIQRMALNNPKCWVVVPSIREGDKTYRHRIFSGFTIEVGYSEPVSEDFFEPWMSALHRPDPKASTYYVTVFFNGLPLDRLLFLQYDGGRNFIPVPFMNRVENKLYAAFSSKQTQIADIVGYDYFDRSFEEVSKSIITSRYNPSFLYLSEEGLQERLKNLEFDLEAYKSRIYGLAR